MTLTLDAPFGTISELIAQHARRNPGHLALADQSGASRGMDYGQLDAALDRIAASLQRQGLRAGDCIAICASASVPYAAVFLGALRAGIVVAPLPPSATPATLARMLADAQASVLFVDAGTEASFAHGASAQVPRVFLDDSAATPLWQWLAPEGTRPEPVRIEPATPFNIIYSSGTTGEPKGIVQPHGMRWAHMRRGLPHGYTTDSAALLSTPLYSNTTLVIFFTVLAFGGAVVLMPRFNADAYLAACERHGATHTMLVPVQYQRLMASEAFDRTDLSRFVMKFCTSAPFSAALKADVLKRWPGGLTEFYGMTEGGASCLLEAHAHPDKLHTVGRPGVGCDIRLIDDAGHEVAPGEAGEVVGHSAGMMNGYHRQPEKTREVEWFDAAGKRFIRTGDIGRFDEDGFLILFDRKKDVIISGGFNVYPSDLEEVLRQHPAVLEAAVVAIPSEQWGESPAAFVVLRGGDRGNVIDAGALQAWVDARVGRMQRLAALHIVPELPRSAIGKVLKRDLREMARGMAHETSPASTQPSDKKDGST